MRNQKIDLPENKKFGFFFSFIFLLACIYFYFSANQSLSYVFLSFSVIFFGVSLCKPVILKPLNKLWFLFGMLLSRIVSPIVLGVIFFIILSPVAILTRAFGRDILKLKKGNIDSYWRQRIDSDFDKQSFTNQF
tara:strand:+ start:276 stop:677 length:402 start_codon:yes stop_codon:yes gene_type:complete